MVPPLLLRPGRGGVLGLITPELRKLRNTVLNSPFRRVSDLLLELYLGLEDACVNSDLTIATSILGHL